MGVRQGHDGAPAQYRRRCAAASILLCPHQGGPQEYCSRRMAGRRARVLGDCPAASSADRRRYRISRHLRHRPVQHDRRRRRRLRARSRDQGVHANLRTIREGLSLMSMILGSGEYRYRVETGWGRLPSGWALKEVSAVAVDRNDQVYVFNRGEHPMIVFDREGNFLRSWGEDIFTHAHGLHMAPDDTIFCTDDGDHTVRRCALDGKVLLTIGTPKQPAPFMSGQPFCRCTHTALSPKGEIYVSDR